MKRVIHINSWVLGWRSLPHIGLRNFTAHHLIPTKANHTSYIPSPERRRRRPLSSSHKNEPAAIEPTAHDYLVLKITHPDSRYLRVAAPAPEFSSLDSIFSGAIFRVWVMCVNCSSVSPHNGIAESSIMIRARNFLDKASCEDAILHP